MITAIEPAGLGPFLHDAGLPVGGPLRDLGKVVVLAGANGSGKSRYLRAIRAAFASALEIEVQLAEPDNTPERLRAMYQPLLASPSGADTAKEILGGLAARDAITWDGKPGRFPNCFNLTHLPGTGIANDRQLVPAQRDELVHTSASGLGFTAPYGAQHAYLAKIARDMFNARRADLATNNDMQERARGAVEFNAIVSSLLGTHVGYELSQSSEPMPTLFGRAYDEQELSAGQKILLGWAVMLHQQRRGLSDAIVLIDEPENHLHPDVCVRALQSLRDNVLGARGQVWLATHSIPLIAWAGAQALHVVREGTVAYAGNAVAAVVDTLVGGQAGREQLRTFLADADQFGFLHFVAQCLAPPPVASTTEGDPQQRSFAALVRRQLTGGRKLRVLDLGAGRGRLADALARSLTGQPELNRITYYAYDPYSEHREERERAVAALNGAGGDGTLLDQLGPLRITGGSVDLVVMCNVLHEIPTANWKTTFEDCVSVLSGDGNLVVIEDQQPSVGELPHHRGFVLLDHSEMQEMFGGAGSVDLLSEDIEDRYRGRLTILRVPARRLTSFSDAGMRGALGIARDRAREELVRLRSANDGERQQAGRAHALYAMLWMNTKLALGDR